MLKPVVKLMAIVFFPPLFTFDFYFFHIGLFGIHEQESASQNVQV